MRTRNIALRSFDLIVGFRDVAREKQRGRREVNLTWLETHINLPVAVSHSLSNTSISKPGRPKKVFETCCSKARKNEVKPRVDSTSSNELLMAAEITLGKERKQDSEEASVSINIGLYVIFINVLKLMKNE
ncbi:hypothetical protein JTB14_017080 [Gonioctena quinquepunctata]|nr:hypothetical protein JTB14_017080 [Gonioctena quinquepunctata]